MKAHHLQKVQIGGLYNIVNYEAQKNISVNKKLNLCIGKQPHFFLPFFTELSTLLFQVLHYKDFLYGFDCACIHSCRVPLFMM